MTQCEAIAVHGMCCDCAKGGPILDFSENDDCPHKEDDGSCWQSFLDGGEQ